MSLYIITILRPVEKVLQRWYFDREVDAQQAKALAQKAGIFASDNFDAPEIITEFHEFAAWWSEEKDNVVKEWLRG